MFCSMCGSENPNDNSFCIKCGAKLKKPDSVVEQVSSSNTASPYQTSPATQSIEPQGQGASINATADATTVIPAVAQPTPNLQPAPAPVPKPVATPTNAAPMPHASTAVPATQVFQAAPATSQPQMTDVAAQAVKKKGKRAPIIITIFAILAICAAAVCVYQVFFASDPCYVRTNWTTAYPSDLDSKYKNSKVNYTISASGVTESVTTTIEGGEPSTKYYKDIGEGLAIPMDSTGTIQRNSDGYVTYYETTDAAGDKSTAAIEYYSPGIIKSRTITNKYVGTTTYRYNEDGWMYERNVRNKTDEEDNDRYFDYVSSNDGKTLTCYLYEDPEHTKNQSFYSKYELDENGNISSISTYPAKNDKYTTYEYTYEEISDPAKMVEVFAHMKN